MTNTLDESLIESIVQLEKLVNTAESIGELIILNRKLQEAMVLLKSLDNKVQNFIEYKEFI